MNRVFLTGVPGSRWSGIAQEIESEGGYDISDRTPERTTLIKEIMLVPTLVQVWSFLQYLIQKT